MMDDYENFRVSGQCQPQYEHRIQKLKSQVKEYAKQKAEQSIFISNQNREVDRLKEELIKKDCRIMATQQESRERELKLKRGGAKSLSDGIDGEESGTEQRLRDHIKEQSKIIVELKETLQVKQYGQAGGEGGGGGWRGFEGVGAGGV